MNNKKQDQLTIAVAKQHIGYWCSALLLLMIITFLSGYFFGKRIGFEKISQKIEHESLSDQIYASLCSVYDVQEETTTDQSPAMSVTEEENNKLGDEDSLLNEKIVDASETAQLYYAKLIGYGTCKPAESFVQRWQARGIMLEVVKRVGKTPKGRNRAWYQVVTPEYKSKEDLEQWVTRISDQENLKDVQIIQL